MKLTRSDLKPILSSVSYYYHCNYGLDKAIRKSIDDVACEYELSKKDWEDTYEHVTNEVNENSHLYIEA